MPACPNPTVLTQSRIHAFSYVVGAFIPSITVGVACNCWPPFPTSSPRPILDRHSGTSPHLFRSRPGHNNETPYAVHSIDRVEMYV
jgi:hypothetical protein